MVCRRDKVSLDDFTMLKTVGKGSFGKVIQVKHTKTDQIYAMKVLKKDHVVRRKQVEHTRTERRILEEVEHPFIVSLRFAFQTTQKLYMVFDFFNGGELFHYLSTGGRFSVERARFYGAEILLGLEHLHGLNIVYRDLKPENLLLDATGHIRITDFGLSKEGVDDDNVKSFCGTPEYLAPEVLNRDPYGKAVDWWSYGTLLYEMLSGLPPYYDRNREKMYQKIMYAKLTFKKHMSEEARDVCAGLLEREPTKRLGYNGATEIKERPFFASMDWDALMRKELDPPFKPDVAGEEDLGNIDPSFTKIPAGVTPTPAGAAPIEAADGKEVGFDAFTFTCANVLEDGKEYAVSFTDSEAEFNALRDAPGDK